MVSKSKRTQKYCKFYLFLDKDVGLAGIHDVASSQGLVQATSDEDYLTDAGVMKNTIKLCKRDLAETHGQILSDPVGVE